MVEGDRRMGVALTRLALRLESVVKTSLAERAHSYGNATTASPGGPPALVSGTLRRAITHSPIVHAFGDWVTKVGTGVGFYPPYGSDPTAANHYGYFLETGLRNGAKYPFMAPGLKHTMATYAEGIWQSTFRGQW